MCRGNLIQIKIQRGRPLTRPVNTLVQQGHQDNAVGNENKLVHGGESCTIPPEHDHRRGNIRYSSEQLLLLSDKVRKNKTLQRLSPETCLNVKRYGLHRRGKHRGVRLRSHLEILRPSESNHNNLIRVEIDNVIILKQLERNITISVFNAQSIRNKEALILDHLLQYKVDLAVVTETWLMDTDRDKVWLQSSDVNKDIYSLSSSIRTCKRGGGVGLIHRKNTDVNTH